MNRITQLLFAYRWQAWCLFIVGVVMATYLAATTVRGLRESERLSLLETEASRRAVELMATTLNGNLMGSVSLLGMIDSEIKREALGQLPANTPRITQVLESVARSYDAEGVFMVTAKGVVGSSWDNSGKPSTGLNVKFRPYYQMGMQGMGNVYAAVSLARGDRALYFASPIYVDTTNGTDAIGVVVARTGLLKIDELLRDKADAAVLLSPQGVVFASSRKEWVGRLAGVPTPERLKAIRELKQFGNMFESAAPAVLPMTVESGLHSIDGQRFAIARASVQWNDPFGDWTLVLMEDLDRSVPWQQRMTVAGATAAILLALGGLLLGALSSQHRQSLATQALAHMAQNQQEQAVHKEQVATAALLLQHATTHPELAQTFLGEMHRIFGALHGALYLVDADAPDSLLCSGTYACVEAPPARLAFGEGLLGQCAIERRPLLVTDVPTGMGTIHSGLGSTAPAALLLAPVMLKDQLMGVVELALLRVLDAEAHEKLMDLTRLLGMNLEIIGRSVVAQETLSKAVAAEQAKARQLAFQQALVDTIPYPVFYKDADARYLGVNRAYEAAFGLQREQLVGKHIQDMTYLPQEERDASAREDAQVIASMTQVERENKVPFADGTWHEGLHVMAGIKNPDGTPGGLVGIFVDHTRLKKAEHDLERLATAERFNRLAQGRERRIVELKHEVNRLAEALGQPPTYESAALQAMQHEAEAFAAEMGIDTQAGDTDLSDPEAVRRLVDSLQQERIAALSLAEDADQARQALENLSKGQTA